MISQVEVPIALAKTFGVTSPVDSALIKQDLNALAEQALNRFAQQANYREEKFNENERR